jgi:hypothetical protein
MGANNSAQYFTFSESACARSNKCGGPIITSLSPASSQTNVYTSQTSGFEPFIRKSSASSSQQNSSGYASRTESITRNCSSTTGNGTYDSGVYSSILKNSNMSLPSAAVITTTSGGGRRGGREEEEEELVDVVTNSPVEMDRQFRPIFKPNDSGNSTPIGVAHGRNSGHQIASNGNNGGARRAYNHSTSSCTNNDDYTNGNTSKNGWSNNHYQPYYSSQTIAN